MKLLGDQLRVLLPDLAGDAEKKLAVVLHDAYCTHNHTDGCSWTHESVGDWTAHAHREWLGRAVVVAAFVKANLLPR